MHRNLGWKSELMQKHFIRADLGLGKVISELVFCLFPPTCLIDHCKQSRIRLDYMVFKVISNLNHPVIP